MGIPILFKFRLCIRAQFYKTTCSIVRDDIAAVKQNKNHELSKSYSNLCITKHSKWINTI